MGGMTTAIDAVKEGIPTLTLAVDLPEGSADPDGASRMRASRRSTTSPAPRKYILGKDGFISYFLWMKAA